MEDLATVVAARFANVGRVERVPAGEELFQEGEWPRDVFLIHEGEVDLVFSARNGMRKPLRVASRGSVLGLGEVVAKTPHDCTATARTPALVGVIPIEQLVRMLDSTPGLWFNVAQVLSADVNSCWDSLRRAHSR